MTRTSTVTPDNVKEYLPCKSTSARLIKGTYYVYKYTAVKLPSGKWGTDSGYVIGKIIPGTSSGSSKRKRLGSTDVVALFRDLLFLQYISISSFLALVIPT